MTDVRILSVLALHEQTYILLHFIIGTVDRYSGIILYGISVRWCHTMELR